MNSIGSDGNNAPKRWMTVELTGPDESSEEKIDHVAVQKS